MNVIFITAALIGITICVLTVIFSTIDFFRISNRLAKVRLGMTTLSGAFFLIQICSVFFYFFVTLAAVNQLVPIAAVVSYAPIFPAALAFYWGYFIPQKLQQWTGILPPSFRRLKEKQRQLAKMKHISS